MAPRKAIDHDEAILSEDDLAGATSQVIEKKSTKARPLTKAGVKRKAPAKQTRPVLTDKTNVQDVIEEEDNEKPRVKRVKTSEATKKPTSRTIQPQIIPETQQESVDEVEQTVERIDETTLLPPRQNSVSRQTSVIPPSRARSTSIQPSYVPVRERSASTEHERRGGDVEMRRQITAMTRECENLNLKNQALEDLVRDKAESNFDKLKRETDQKTKQADDLIAALKKEIATLRKACSNTSTVTSTLEAKLKSTNETYEQVKVENVRLEQDLSSTKENLLSIDNERKSLEAKLAAARQQLANEAAEAKSSSSRSNNSKPTEAQKEAKMKLDLYTDLTGLIIRGVKRKEGEDEYDCLQTGRNGALHFRLSVMNETSISNPKTPGLSYEEAEFSYEPLLELPRDDNLLSILPDYLSEDICFPRNHAVKFYSKVVESMTRRIVVEEE